MPADMGNAVAIVRLLEALSKTLLSGFRENQPVPVFTMQGFIHALQLALLIDAQSHTLFNQHTDGQDANGRQGNGGPHALQLNQELIPTRPAGNTFVGCRHPTVADKEAEQQNAQSAADPMNAKAIQAVVPVSTAPGSEPRTILAGSIYKKAKNAVFNENVIKPPFSISILNTGFQCSLSAQGKPHNDLMNIAIVVLHGAPHNRHAQARSTAAHNLFV